MNIPILEPKEMSMHDLIHQYCRVDGTLGNEKLSSQDFENLYEYKNSMYNEMLRRDGLLNEFLTKNK